MTQPTQDANAPEQQRPGDTRKPLEPDAGGSGQPANQPNETGDSPAGGKDRPIQPRGDDPTNG